MRAVDLFAGWGGFTLAAEAAGADVLVAANHWRLAVEAHQANHPKVRQHVCQDLRQADWAALPEYELLLASPACQGHSQAAQPSRKRSKRTRQYHDALRATAWAVVDCAEVTRPRALVVENVPDFMTWSSDPDDPAKRGDMFRHWLAALRLLGYRVHVRVLRASVHADVPQRRDRVFVVGIRGRKRAGESAVLDLPESPEPAFWPSIEWDDPDPWWRRADEQSAALRARVARGRARHGRRFITQHVTGHPGLGEGEPLRTVTTQDQWAIVDGPWYRNLTIRENARAQGFPEGYRWPAHARRCDMIKGLGNAVPPPLAQPVIERVGGLL